MVFNLAYEHMRRDSVIGGFEEAERGTKAGSPSLSS